MAFSASDLATIETAIASGALRVRFADGRQVDYQSGADLLRARDIMRAEINAEAATPPQRISRVVHVRA